MSTPGKTEFNLYDDEGTNYNYEKGDYSVIPFSFDDRTRTLTIGGRKGAFKGMQEIRNFNVVLLEPDHPIKDAHLAGGKSVRYDGKSVQLRLLLHSYRNAHDKRPVDSCLQGVCHTTVLWFYLTITFLVSLPYLTI